MNDSPTPVDRIEAALDELGRINLVLERLWAERHELFRAYRALRIVRKSLEMARHGLEGQ